MKKSKSKSKKKQMAPKYLIVTAIIMFIIALLLYGFIAYAAFCIPQM